MPQVWTDPTPLRVLGMGTALPGVPIGTDELLDLVEARFGLSLRGCGVTIARKLGIQFRHVCRPFDHPAEGTRPGQRNPELAAQAVRDALEEAGLAASDLGCLIGHTAAPANTLPANVARVAAELGYHGGRRGALHGHREALRTRAVLQGLDLQVRRGEVLGLVGANGGSGTAIVRIMAGLLQPDAGACTVFGEAPARVRRRIGYLAQGQGLYGHLTVAKDLQVRAMLFGLPDPSRVAADALQRFGLASHAAVRVAQLSDGWARWVRFAAALIHGPDLLLLDEPTTGLDAAAQREVWRHVLHLATGGVTVVVSTHDLAEAERFCRVAFLVNGVARAQGTVTKAVRQPDACSFTLRGPDVAGAAADALGTAGVMAAYPSAGRWGRRPPRRSGRGRRQQTDCPAWTTSTP